MHREYNQFLRPAAPQTHCQRDLLLLVAHNNKLGSVCICQVATASITNDTRIVASLWSQIFLDSSEYPNTPAEAEWLNMLISEPALLESSLAVTTQHWAADISRQQNTHVHSTRAVNTLIQRINSRQAHTDAVLAVVCTMAIGGRLANDDVVWSIHMRGVTHLIRERYARGIFHLPSWFTDLLLSFVRPFALYVHSSRLTDYSATQSTISLTSREYIIQRLLVH